MTLKTKTMGSIIATIVVLIVLLFVVSTTIIKSAAKKMDVQLTAGFELVEQDDARRNISRVSDALTQNIDNLAVKVSDWAQWDDCWEFVQNRNVEFTTSNINIDACRSLHLNLLMIVDTAGLAVAEMAIDLGGDTQIVVPAEFDPLLRQGGVLHPDCNPGTVLSGVLLISGEVWMLASRPIVRSSGEGPVRGAVLFGRLLDSIEVSHLGKLTHLDVSVSRVPAASDRDSITTLLMQKTSQPIIRALDQKYIAGYTVIADIRGDPLLVLRSIAPREIYRQGMTTLAKVDTANRTMMLLLFIAIIATGLIIGIVVICILHTSVLKRLFSLSASASGIGERGDFSARVEACGDDEIGRLSHAVNGMLAALQQSHTLIANRNAEISLLMHHLPVGVLSLNSEFRVNAEYSRIIETILGNDDIVHADFFSLLQFDARSPERAELWEFLDLLRARALPEKEMALLNPFPQHSLIRDGTVWVSLHYFLMQGADGKTGDILVLLQDITEQKKLAHDVEQSRQENVQLKAIAEDPDLFMELLIEIASILDNAAVVARSLEPGTSPGEKVNELYRGAHTIKGIAGGFGFDSLMQRCTAFENDLSCYRSQSILEPENLSAITRSIIELGEYYHEVRRTTAGVLGEETAMESSIHLRITLAQLAMHIDAIRNAPGSVDVLRKEAVARLQALKMIPARRGLHRCVKIVSGICRKLQREAHLVFIGADTLIDVEIAHILNDPLMHLLRNAIDHGIESPEQRLEQGKSEEGTLTLHVSRNGGRLLISLQDDGRGIDSLMLKKTAISRGFISSVEADALSAEEAMRLIFLPGFSTAETVTELSGRGVGLDAVAAVVRNQLGGDLHVESSPGEGTTVSLWVPDRLMEP